jgi:mannose-binding lectin 2
MFGKQWTSLCLLAGSLTGALGLGLEEHPDVKAITVSLGLTRCNNTC